jgi:hypothetical protein
MLIDALCKGTGNETKIFEEIIKKPNSVQQAQNKPEVGCEEWQAIL